MIIGLVDHGLSNVDSIERALQLCGASVVRISSSEQKVDLDKLVLPGVGSFDAAMIALNELGLTSFIRDFAVLHQKPILGICLGMQLLLSKSEEGRPMPGLNLIPGTVKKILPLESERVPHVGWNQIEIARDSELLSSDMNLKDFYFVHSYCASVDDEQHILATTPFATGIQAVIGSGRIYGTQFHPEKSNKPGLEILNHFVTRC
jgi:glutamine amidotransferase